MTTCECPNCGATISPAALLGSSTSDAKRAAAIANGSKPCAPGKQRGRPRKSPPP